MSLVTRVHPSFHPDATIGGARRGLQVLLEIGRAMAREVRARRSLRDVSSLDDTMLHDLGIGRGELENVVRHGRERENVVQGFELNRPDRGPTRVSSWTEWR